MAERKGRFQVFHEVGRNSRFALPRLRLVSEHVPSEFDGFTVVQLSDLHLGKATSLKHVEHALELAKAASPEMILLTGDLVQVNRLGMDDALCRVVGPTLSGFKRSRRLAGEIARDLGKLLDHYRPPLGYVGVFGNHDYREGLSRIVRELPSHIRWLKNSAFELCRGEQRLVVYGIDDIWQGKPDLEQTVKAHPGADAFCRIFLCHNPDLVLHDHASLLEPMDLMLSGHTHGGQIRLPFLGPLTTRTAQREHTWGLSWFGSTAVYTTSGAGYGLVGMRIGCPPEVVAITFRRQP